MSNRTASVGGVPMVQIDGQKIRELREEKSLTQLYLATAVEVTTDTISRWENRRYPAIKKENALKLAEALEVELEVILEKEALAKDKAVTTGNVHQPNTQFEQKSAPRKIYIALTILCLLLVGLLLYWWPTSINTQVQATRLMPRHSPPGQPFPVVLRLSSPALKTATVIIKEVIPTQTVVSPVNSIKSTASNDSKGQVKWIKKIKGEDIFGYSLHSTGLVVGKIIDIAGEVTVRKFRGAPRVTGGDHRIEIAAFHWSDANKDNKIDDQEILAVYDDYSEIPGVSLDMDLIEDIWFGSGYHWDHQNKTFVISP